MNDSAVLAGARKSSAEEYSLMMDDPIRDLMRDMARQQQEMIELANRPIAELVKKVLEEVSAKGPIANEMREFEDRIRAELQKPVAEMLARLQQKAADQLAQFLPPVQDPLVARRRKLLVDMEVLRALLTFVEHEWQRLSSQLENGHEHGAPQGYRPDC